jgi:hypothetical protein
VALRRLIGRCLKKDRGRRFHHVADVGLEIEDCLVDGGQAAEVEVPARKTATRRVSWSHVGVAVVSAVLAALLAVRNGPETSRDVTRSILESLPATGGTVQGVAVSPGGRDVVYSAGGMLHWRSLGSESAPLPGTEGGVLPAFSRDGSSVAFFVPGESAIMRLAAATGQITRVTTTDGGAPVGLSWTPDDRIIYATTLSQGLRETPGLGGVSEPLTRVVAGDAIGHYWPSVLPDGRGVLIEVFRGGSSQVAVVSLETREVTPLVDVGGRPRLLPTGHLVYLRDDGLWAAAFDLRRQTLASPPVNVGGPRILGANFDVAADGSLVYVPDVAAAPSQELVWLDREGHEDPLDLPRGMYTTVRISPDEQRIVASLRPPGLGPPGLYVSDIDRPGFRPIATPAPEGGQWFPLWTPDSIDVLFGIYPTRDQVPAGLFRARADGTGTVEAVRTLPDSGFLDPRTWTPEGDLLFTYGPPGATRAGRLSLESAAWSPLFDGADGIWPSAVSPDGRWVVTERLREPGNQTDLYIEPFPGPGRPQPIAQSARNAVWSPDDPTVLFYRRTTDWAMMSVTVETTPVLSIGSPSEVIDLSPGHRWGQASRAWDVAKDGRFLMLKRVDANLTEESQQLRLIQNWTVELEDTLPADR